MRRLAKRKETTTGKCVKKQKINNKENCKINNTNCPELKNSIIEYSIGKLDVFRYEGEYFPGSIIENTGEEVKIKAMAMMCNNWKWPNKDDISLYPLTSIVCIINPPAIVNKRGVYKVPELNNLRRIKSLESKIIYIF